MSFFDNLFGRPLSKDKFAQMVMDAVYSKGEKGKILYDQDEFRLEVEGEKGNQYYLANVYREYCAASKQRRTEILQRWVRSWFSTGKEMPKEFADVHPDLLPIVRSRSFYEMIRLRAKLEDIEFPECPYQELDDLLVVGLAYDLPESLRTISQGDLDAWGVSFYEALEAALNNLRGLAPKYIGPAEGEGLYLSATGDSYDASRILMLDFIRHFKVKGDHIAMVPNRDNLIVTGSEDEEGLKGMLTLAKKALKEPRSIGGTALRLDGENWTTWLPPHSHPLHQEFRLLQVQEYSQDYAEQKDLLDKLHQKNGTDIFVATYSGIQDNNTGEVTSYCVWSKGCDALLPKTDSIMFMENNAEPVMVEWDGAVEVFGDLMEPQDIYPLRWRVKDYPSKEKLLSVGKEIRK